MMRAEAVNPLYANIGLQLGLHTYQSPYVMPRTQNAMADFSQPSGQMAAKTSETSADRVPM